MSEAKKTAAKKPAEKKEAVKKTVKTAATVKAAKPVLTRELLNACIGVDVKFLQTLLRSKGYDCGKVDGDFGGKTEKAVLKFQNDNRLTVDGIVGKNTAKKLGFKWGGA